jgi:signal transduction histidine kinase
VRLLGPLVGALALLTGAIYLQPILGYAAIAPEADRLINTAAMVAAASVAGFAWIRYRDSASTDALLQSAAFLTLFTIAALRAAVMTAGSDYYSGYDIQTAGQAPLYSWIYARFVAGLLLLFGAVALLRRRTTVGPRRALVIGVVPSVTAIIVGVLAMLGEAYLPPLLPAATLAQLADPPPAFEANMISPALLVIETLIGLIFAAAAIAYARFWSVGGRGGYSALLAASLVFAAFSQLHYAFVPGGYGNLLTSGDFLRFGFYLLVLGAVGAAIQEDVGRLRRAYVDLDRLRRADAERISAEERARLARDVHDGLVQELWLARLTGGRLVDLPRMPAEARPMLKRLDAALETALSEARQALITLQPRSGDSFGDLLSRFIDDYADRFDLDIQRDLEPDSERTPPPDVQTELLRICREALNNARKHADASVVRVHLESAPATLKLTISDNGRGFDTAAESRGFGMASMRQRAAKIGAALVIRSAPMDGTSIVVELPLAPRRTVAVAGE